MSRLSFSRAVVPALAALLGLLPAAARAEVPSRVPIQGTLRDVAGAPIDGTLPCTFSLYAQRAGGVALWTETEDVPFDAGFFSLYLGARSPLRVSFFRDNQLLYLGIAVDGDPEMARIELATAPFAAFAQYAGDALTVGGLHASDFAPVDHRTDWTTLDNIPADLADGDANTTYDTTAGGGLTLSGTSFGLDTTCTPGQLLKRDAAGWSCADDAQGADNPTDELLQTVTYDPATHVLSLTDAGQTFNLDLTTLAAPDADADPTNELTVSATLDGTTLHLTDAGGTLDVDLSSLVVDLSTVDQSDQNELNTALVLNGTELVLTDAGGDLTVDLAALQDGNTTYTAGNGLTLTDTEFAVDTTVVQSRVSGACAVGSSIQTIGEDGSVTCEVDADTLYAAGSGLALAGTVFSVDPAAVQSRVSGVCAPGSSVQTIAPDGTVTCEIDDNTTYTAGGGLALAGTIFSVDPATVQSRVAGTCPAGSSIRTVAQDGTVA